MPIVEGYDIYTVDDLVSVLGEKEVEEIVKNALEQAAKQYAISKDSGGEYRIEVDWDYDSRDSLKRVVIDDILPKVFQKEENLTNVDELYCAICNGAEDYAFANSWFDGADDYAYGEIESLFNKTAAAKITEKTGIEDVDVNIDRSELHEYIDSNFGLYTDTKIWEEIENMEFRVNLICCTPTELNGDLVSIPRMPKYVEDWVKEGAVKSPSDLDRYECDNFLKVMTRTQGYNLYDLLVSNGKSTYLDSVRAEYGEFFAYNGIVVVLGTIDFNTLLNIYAKTGKGCKVTTKCAVGFYDPLSGSGSLLDIKLEKDFDIDRENIWDVQIDEGHDTFSRCGYYTVNDTFGLVGEAWKGEIKPR